MKRGFTLSEVLITLGIVGVVAVLTVPSVMKNYSNRLYVSQLQKTYAQISDAVQAIMHNENVDNFYETTAANPNIIKNAQTGKGTAGLALFLSEYFKVNKYDCNNNIKHCVATGRTAADTYTSMQGQNLGPLIPILYCVQTVNGASICGLPEGDKKLNLFIDVNGPSAPNVTGRDLFLVTIRPDGTVTDFVGNSSATWTNFDSQPAAACNTGGNLITTANGCLNAVIDAGWKMEY